MSKYVNIDGTIYNVGLSVTPMGPRYNIVCFYPSRVTIGKIFFFVKM